MKFYNRTKEIQAIKRDFQKDLGFVYEEVIRDFLLSGKYGLIFLQLGKWWKGSREEIDIVGTNQQDSVSTQKIKKISRYWKHYKKGGSLLNGNTKIQKLVFYILLFLIADSQKILLSMLNSIKFLS